MGTFDGKVVIITGGGYGIGRGTALEFAREGAKVAIADVDKTASEAVVAEIQNIGSKAIHILADASKSSDCERVIEKTIESFGSINILFNNVGIQSPDSYHNVENTSEELWDKILNVNLKSYFLMSKFAIPYIRKEGGGVFVDLFDDYRLSGGFVSHGPTPRSPWTDANRVWVMSSTSEKVGRMCDASVFRANSTET